MEALSFTALDRHSCLNTGCLAFPLDVGILPYKIIFFKSVHFFFKNMEQNYHLMLLQASTFSHKEKNVFHHHRLYS